MNKIMHPLVCQMVPGIFVPRSDRSAGNAALDEKQPLWMRYLFALFLAFTVSFGASGVARATDKDRTSGKHTSQAKVLLELFTSQGCSSCPPADALLEEFAGRKDVIAVSLPVDYWDYLGWRDTLAKKRFTTRQQAYAKRFRARRSGDGMVYTPQLVVDGRAHAVGSDRSTILAEIKKRKKVLATGRHIKLGVVTSDELLVVSVGAAQEAGEAPKATLWLATVSRKVNVNVKRGENRGRKLNYHNVVRSLMPIGQWTGKEMRVKLPKAQIMQKGADGCIIVLQEEEGGPVLGVAEMGSH